MSDESTVVTVADDGSTLVSTVEFQDGLRRVKNLASWVALGTVPKYRYKPGLIYVPDFSWLECGAAPGLTA